MWIKILLFLIFNLAGFFATSLLFVISLKLGVITADNIDQFSPSIFLGASLTWLTCALYSVAYFFIKGKMKFFFLSAPLVFPLSYGITSLVF